MKKNKIEKIKKYYTDLSPEKKLVYGSITAFALGVVVGLMIKRR